MENRKVTVREATEKWVGTFDGIPTSLIEKAYNSDEYNELTVRELECSECGERGCYEHDDICKCQKNPLTYDEWFRDEYYEADSDTEESIKEEYQEYCEEFEGEKTFEEIEDNYGYGLPSWGTMWTMCNLDADWIESNLEIVSEIGFSIFESDELGIFIGLDGGGYDFYEAHWIPLYKARGMHWHTEE